MLIKIFKIITTIILVGVLFTLMTKRDLYLFVQEKINIIKPSLSQGNTSTRTQQEQPEETLLMQQEEAPLKKDTDTSEIAPPKLPAPPQPTIPKQTTEKKTDGVYVHLEEGVSDTDPTYQPEISPCSSPMGYKIGTFDSRFGISKAQFIQVINQSAQVWGEVANKNLFYYSENGPLTINLIYDKRQATTVTINNLAFEIENSKQYAEGLRTAYEQEKITYIKEGDQLTKDTENFQLRYKAYGEKVTTYNAAGGAQKIEYEAMMSELAQLKEEAKILEGRRASLISLMESINKKVARYNEFVSYINGLIRQTNALGAVKFTEGKFTPYTNTIDIYQYNDSIKLHRVVTHELGHVLGINHTENIYSIMYSFNSATTTTLSKEDIRAFKEVCPLQ